LADANNPAAVVKQGGNNNNGGRSLQDLDIFITEMLDQFEDFQANQTGA
jgi:hypothetical protein